MRHLIYIFTIFTLIGCNGNGQKSVSKNGSLELDSESSKEFRDKFEQQNKDSLIKKSDSDEYLFESLHSIRLNFKRINGITKWTSIEKRELNQSLEGGIATYYFMKDTLLKIVAIIYGETGKINQEFYTQDGELSFVFEQNYQYNRPIYWDSLAMKENNDSESFNLEKSDVLEDCSYFENGELIRQINNQDCGAPFSEEYLQEEQVRIKGDFEKLKNRLIK
jgi:hypothetical protein